MRFNSTEVFTKAVTALFIPAMLLASPMIEIDTIDVSFGTLIEGQIKSAKHTFKVKNTGDSVLTIQNVKPG